MHVIQYNMDITNHCQAKCAACNRTDPATNKPVFFLKLQHVSLADFMRRTDNLCSINTQSKIRIQLCGEWGDPMMHPKINDILSYLENKPEVFHILINTNGGLRNPSWYTKAAEQYKKLRIIFGIDGTTHEINDLYRTGVNTERAIANMRAFNNAGGDTTWQYIVFSWNWHEIPRAKKLARRWKVGQYFFVNNISPVGLIPKEHEEEIFQMVKRK